VQRREMTGDKADGAQMAVQPRRTRTRWQSRDCGAVRGLCGCPASFTAKRRPAFSADLQAPHMPTNKRTEQVPPEGRDPKTPHPITMRSCRDGSAHRFASTQQCDLFLKVKVSTMATVALNLAGVRKIFRTRKWRQNKIVPIGSVWCGIIICHEHSKEST
jgi:hypothetical protein